MDSSQENALPLGNFKSDVTINPTKTPLYVTQEALSMLEAYLNISYLNRHKASKSNSVFLTHTNKLSDLTTGESYVRHDNFHTNSMKEHIVKSELLDDDQGKVRKYKIMLLPSCQICTYTIHLKRIVSIDDRKRFSLSHVNNNITYLNDARLSNIELISTKILQQLNESFPETTKISEIHPYFDNVDGLDTKFLQSGLLCNLQDTEPPNSPVFEMSSQTSITKDNFSSSKKFALRDVSSSIMRYHSESCGSTQKTDVTPKMEKWSIFGVNCYHNQYTRRSSVRSAPEDMHYCIRAKPKRCAFKKWFKFRLPKSNFSSKSHVENKLYLVEGDKSNSKHIFKENISVLENRDYNNCDGDNGTYFTTEPGRKLSTDEINKPFGRIHHPPFINVCAQLFPRLFRQSEPSSSSYISSGFFPRMQKLSASTIRRVKRTKQNARKFGKICTQCSKEEQEKFQLLPLYTKQRSPKSSHFVKDELSGNKGSLIVKQKVHNISDKSDDSSDTDSPKNVLFNTPLMNSKTWPIGSPNVKVSGEITRLYRGLIETIESDKFMGSTSQTWSQIQFSNNINNLPSTNWNSAIQCTKSNKPTWYSSLKDLPTGKCSTYRSKFTNEMMFSREKSNKKLKDTIISSKELQENNFSAKNNLSEDGATCSLVKCLAKNSSETPEIHDGLKAQDIDHSPTDDTTQYPYAKYVAAMIDALSERLMGKISEDDLELRFQTLEAEASKVSAKRISQPVVKRERFYSVSNEVGSLCCRNSLQNALGNALSDENLLTNVAAIGKLGNERCHSLPILHIMTDQFDLHDVVPLSLESSHRSLKHCCLAQVKRLKLRNKLIITTNLLNRLVNHTNYPSFEGDVLELLGRQPSWHRIAILYYLTRCSVKHILNLHIQRLKTLQGTSSSVLHHTVFNNSDSEEIDENHSQPPRSKLPQYNLDPSNPTYEKIFEDIGQCRANIGRIKDYTITFFTRWYADWVYKRGGWQSVIDETEDSELD
ncbi:hypothetical protein MN116_001827 [Schistosoma mekongi]|uniref:Uncharacterized protein n=1 Tax=Schistosoma mekongi TaxID=38744 RepID=A0AAE2D825_SCHME|nr:hypothetical protein MN116_001827 [Schistosoma mekongi]